MNFLKRGLLSVRKKFTKTLLILISFFIIASLVLSGLIVQSASEKAKDLAREKLGATVTLRVDTQKISTMLREQMRELGTIPEINIEPIETDKIHEVGEFEEVLGYNIKNSASLIAGNFEIVKDPDLEAERQELEAKKQEMLDQGKTLEEAQEELDRIQKEYDADNAKRPGGGGFELKIPQLPGMDFNFNFDIKNTNINTIALYNLEYETDFISGKNTLIEGDYITNEHVGQNVVIIEEEIADMNELTIGDTIEVNDFNEEITTTLEIIGIYRTDDKYGAEIERISSESQIPANSMYIPLNVAVTDTIVENSTTTEIEYALTDPILVNNFLEKANSIEGIDFEYYLFDANNDAYEKMMGPIENVSNFANLGTLGIIIAGAIILSLISALAIKDRRYELGVLLSIGESKLKIIGQLLFESLIVFVIAFVIAIPTSNYVSNEMSNVLIQNEINYQEEQDSQNPFGGGGRGFINNLSEVEVIDELAINISTEDLLNMFMIGLLIVMVSTVIPSITVLRYNPKTILSNRD